MSKTIKEKIEIMQAFMDSAEIECRGDFGGWKETDTPSWDWYGYDYRIKQYEYPMWFKDISRESLGLIVKFTSLSTGEIVRSDTDLYKVGNVSEWTYHTDKSTWEQVEDPNKLNDKDAVWFWDSNSVTQRSIGFWDAKKNCVFHHSGDRGGLSYENYEKIQRTNEPKWVKEARKYLAP